MYKADVSRIDVVKNKVFVSEQFGARDGQRVALMS